MAFARDLSKKFTRLADQGALGHAYLFFGESPEVLENFALSLASYLETRAFRVPEKALLDSKALHAETREDGGIASVREAFHWLWQKPFLSPRRTLLIYGAETLTLQAKHAFLKVVEEPPASGLLLFTSRNPDALPPALASRFQVVYISDRKTVDRAAARGLAEPFLRASGKSRSETLKALREEPERYIELLHALLAVLGDRPLEHWKTLRALLECLVRTEQYNVNRKLQLEAAMVS